MLFESKPPRCIYQLPEWLELSWSFLSIHFAVYNNPGFLGYQRPSNQSFTWLISSEYVTVGLQRHDKVAASSFKSRDLKNPCILINHLFSQVLNMSTAQPNGHFYKGAVLFHLVLHIFAGCLFLILSSWKNEV